MDHFFYSKDSFHGTSISLLQHPSSVSEGHDQGVQIISRSSSNVSRSVAIPIHYTNVPLASIKTKEFTAPAVDSPMGPITLSNIEKAKETETEWLDKVMAALTVEVYNVGVVKAPCFVYIPDMTNNRVQCF